MVKKFLCLLLACMMTVSMYACVGRGEPADGTTDTQESESDSAAETEDLDVDVVYDGIDHVIQVPKGKDITILQLADTQAMLYEGIRKSFISSLDGKEHNTTQRFDQLAGECFPEGAPKDMYTRVWQYVEEGVQKTNPDVIVLTGDNIGGETDDKGELWLEMIDVLDSFEIPWIMVFGNHDPESNMGVDWQVEAVQNSKYGFMKDGDLENGHSNYTVGIRQGKELKYVFYMLDTNGPAYHQWNKLEGLQTQNPNYDDIQQSIGIFADQVAWINACNDKISAYAPDVPSMMFYHIPPIEVTTAEIEQGIHKENMGGFNTGVNAQFFEAAKAANCVGMFVGHQHKIAVSARYEGILITYGLKSGTGDYHDPEMLGTTKITISKEDNSFDVEYVFSEIEYPMP